MDHYHSLKFNRRSRFSNRNRFSKILDSLSSFANDAVGKRVEA